MFDILKNRVKIGNYRLKIDSIFSYYPTISSERDCWYIIIECITPDGISELGAKFDTENERNQVLLEIDKLLTINPMNLRKEKLEEINQNNK